jgi:hypothetical protein
MDAIIELSWRAYPAALLIVLGVAGAVRSAVTHARRAGLLRDPARALAIMRGFRIAIVSLAVAAIGVAWCWQLGWLFVLALVIGGEELLESTVVIAALANGPGSAAQRRSGARRLAAALGWDGRGWRDLFSPRSPPTP